MPTLPERKIDVLIIGAGPAGLSTALHLIQNGRFGKNRIVVLEKAAHPRHKLCGGGVTRLGLAALAELGMPYPLPLPQARVEDVRLAYRERTIHVRGQPQFVVFERSALDNYLAQMARQRGVELLENEAVESLEFSPDEVRVRTKTARYRAQVVVGADGSKGITRRLLKSPMRSLPRRVARLLEVVHPAPDDAPQFGERYALFDFTPGEQALQGYFWDFPSRMGVQSALNRGVYDARMAPSREKAVLPTILGEEMARHGTSLNPQQLAGHPIHWFSPRGTFSSPRLLAVGDAAGVDPLFGEGIGPALAYGAVAAETLEDAFARQDFSLRTYRRRVLVSPVGRYLLLRWLAAWWGYRLGGQTWFMHTLWSLGGLLARVWPQPPILLDGEGKLLVDDDNMLGNRTRRKLDR